MITKTSRPVYQQVNEIAIAKMLGGGWYRGVATSRYVCEACAGAIAEGTDIAVQSTRTSLRTFHGVCYEQWRRR